MSHEQKEDQEPGIDEVRMVLTRIDAEFKAGKAAQRFNPSSGWESFKDGYLRGIKSKRGEVLFNLLNDNLDRMPAEEQNALVSMIEKLKKGELK